jgi:uncharacterized 2Fe-2S/4Fe-4S cluster protein (DUF4445 family)
MSGLTNQTAAILQEQTLTKVEPDPMSKKFYLELSPPSLLNNQADVDRLRDDLAPLAGHVTVPLALMNILPGVCRDGDWRVTVTLGRTTGGWALIGAEPGDTTARHFGLAVDVGTTTVVVYLVDLRSGDILGVKADYNGQVVMGEDILTRISVARKQEGALELRKAVLDTINRLINDLAGDKEISTGEISACAMGANSTMVHLLLGLEPNRICKPPYIPVVNNPGLLAAGEVGLDIMPLAPVYFLPGVGSYVGGDVIGGVLVSGMYKSSEITLFVDIGTNGEMILGNKDWLAACAGAAGPALEGGVALSGMRAEPGAVEWVRLDPDTGRVKYRTIGGAKPRGICGSGLVDCLAEFLLAGIIDLAGKFKDGGDYYVVAPAAETEHGMDIKVTQEDINNLLRTKGAVNAALEVLLDAVGYGAEDIKRFYAAGAFGQYLDLESAITIGLYPDLPRDSMVRLGNSSGEGARQVLMSGQLRREAEKIATNITYFELIANDMFVQKFSSSRFLPHTNLDYFPTVKARLRERGIIT